MRNTIVPACLLAAGLLGVSAFAGNAPLDVILTSGTAAPNTEAGTQFLSFMAPAVSENGNFAFVGNLSSTSQASGIWTGTPGNWTLLAREGQSLSGGVGPLKSLVKSAIAFNSNNQVAFIASSGSGDGTLRVFRASQALGVQVLASVGQQAPGMAIGVTFRDFGDPVINAAGQISFNASLQGPGITSANQGSVWLYSASVLLPVIKGGDIPNVLQPTTTVRELMLPLLNSTGKLAFGGVVQGPLVAPINESARWTATNWVPSLQIVGGTLVSLSEDGGGYVVRRLLPGMHRMNSAGTIVFFADHDDAYAPPKFAHSIWLTTPTGIIPIVTRTTPLQAYGEPLNISSFSSVAIDSAGNVHFKASVRGAQTTTETDHGFFTRLPSGLVVQRVRAGQLAVGVSGARKTLELSPYAAVGPQGELFLTAPLQGFIPGTRYDRVLFVSYPNGTSSKVVATGDSLVVNGKSKTITAIGNYYTGNGQDGLASSINANGQFVFRVQFTDNSWAIVRNQLTTPCLGDFNGDHVVDDEDFAYFASYYDALTSGPGDLDQNGACDDADFVRFAVTYTNLLCP
ncbi:MAG: DUF7453 family protein [Phycisphaerales bacterium]